MATTTIVPTGDTITISAQFKDASGDLIDADGNAVTFTVYNTETTDIVATGAATRVSIGDYFYEWLVPSESGVGYIVEMKGLFGTKPQLKRGKVKAKFRP